MPQIASKPAKKSSRKSKEVANPKKKRKSFKDSPLKLVRFKKKKKLLERNIKRINIKGRTKGNRDK